MASDAMLEVRGLPGTLSVTGEIAMSKEVTLHGASPCEGDSSSLSLLEQHEEGETTPSPPCGVGGAPWMERVSLGEGMAVAEESALCRDLVLDSFDDAEGILLMVMILGEASTTSFIGATDSSFLGLLWDSLPETLTFSTFPEERVLLADPRCLLLLALESLMERDDLRVDSSESLLGVEDLAHDSLRSLK